MAKASKDEIAECARLLALNLAHYKQKYGELPLNEQEQLATETEVTDETARLLASGMLEMSVTLSLVTGNTDDIDKLQNWAESLHLTALGRRITAFAGPRGGIDSW